MQASGVRRGASVAGADREHTGQRGGVGVCHDTDASRRTPHAPAFTLIELIAVLVVTAILAATAAASLTRSAATRGAMAGQQLTRDLNFARERAVATGVRTWIVFDNAADSYTLRAENPGAPGYAGAATLTDPATGRDYIVTLNTGEFAGVGISGVSIPGGSTTLGFDWLGRPLLPAGTLISADITVTLTGGVSVTVEGGTGLVYPPSVPPVSSGS